MSELTASYERILLEKLNNDDQSAFTIIFTKYYQDLVQFSYSFTRNPDASEEIVQEVFLKLWENRNSLVIHNSLKSFLLKAVQNRSIDSLRHISITHKYASLVLEHPILLENEGAGIYFYKMITENQCVTKKMIKVKYEK